MGNLLKFQPVGDKAVPGATVELFVDGQQVHRRKIGRGIPLFSVSHALPRPFHPLAVRGRQKHRSGKAPDHRMQAGVQAAVMGEGFTDRFRIVYSPGLNAFRQPGTAICRTAFPFSILLAELAVHVFRFVVKCGKEQ